MAEANGIQRKPAPLSKLIIGLECGGSDGFSGITANPVVGFCSDLVADLGGSIVLAEFPELHGVEQNLIDRSISLPVATRFMELMKQYATAAEKAETGFVINLPLALIFSDALNPDLVFTAYPRLGNNGYNAQVCCCFLFTNLLAQPSRYKCTRVHHATSIPTDCLHKSNLNSTASVTHLNYQPTNQ